MSAFSNVDAAPDPDRLIAYLDNSGLTAMRHYMAETHALACPTAPILDVGCGIGRDLGALEAAGVPAVGVDPSSTLLGVAAERVPVPLVRATGERLPFPAGAFAGCLLQRVLMHVDDPAALVREAVRCLRSGGLLTVFEPDWSTLTVNGAPVPVRWVSIARHPAVGGRVGELLQEAGCALRDRVEERSWWSFPEFERITNLGQRLERAVDSGVATPAEVEGWLAAVHASIDRGEFRAEIVKLLWVAVAP